MDELCEPARSPPLAITHALFLTEKLVTAVMILPVSLRLKDDGCIIMFCRRPLTTRC